jgi:hypothetical protein
MRSNASFSLPNNALVPTCKSEALLHAAQRKRWVIQAMNAVTLTLLLLIASPVHSDTWSLPTPMTYTSREGQFRLTVFPRRLAGQLRYFEDSVEGRELAGQKLGEQPRCEAVLEKLVADHYEQLWRKPLVNDVAPVNALVSDLDGAFVTFDNWHSMGWGENTIVVYSGSGDVRKRLQLTDFLSEKEFEQLPRSVSSIHWSGEHYLDNSDPPIVHLEVITREKYKRDRVDRDIKNVKIRLDTGEIVQ